MKRAALVVSSTLLASFVVFLSGDIYICDWEGGCGSGFPEPVFYLSGYVLVASLAACVGLTLVACARALRRSRDQ